MDEYEVRDAYYRVQHSMLEIYDWYLEKTEMNDEMGRYKFRAFVRNTGKIVENQFKLNVNFEGTDICSLQFEYLPSVKAMGTIDGFRFAINSSQPIYPDEIIELDNFEIAIPLEILESALSNINLSLELFFGQSGRNACTGMMINRVRQK